MRYLLFVAIAALTQVALSQVQNAATTVIVTVTVPPSNSPTPAAVVPQAESTEANESETQSAPSSSASLVTSSTSADSQSQPSWPASESDPSQTLPEVSAAATTTQSDYYEPGASSLGTGEVDTAGGASGSSAAAFHLSKGGLAAILIVVILVGLFGIANIVLFIVAKRRQWTMRQTLTRASRRLTGRFGQPKTPTAAADRRSRRTGVRMASPPRPGVKAVYPPGHKRGLVVDVKDPEKGPQPLDGKAPKNTRPRENTWIKRVWGDGWK